MLDGQSGISTYARAVRAAIDIMDLTPGWISAAPPGGKGLADRLPRYLSALSRRVRDLPCEEGGDARIYDGGELFRIAQVYFDIHGRLLRIRLGGAPGIMHWTYPLPLHAEGWVNLYTVHDTIPLDRPDLSPINSGRFRRLLQQVARSCDGILTVSEWSRRAIASATGLPARRIYDCGEAVILPDRVSRQVTEPYLLVCGSIEPRKNIVATVRGYQRAATHLPLVIAGPDGWRADQIRQELSEVKGIRWLPAQTRDGMAGLIANARALIMASLCEGFGLPVAEAMTLGVPVVTSRGGALAETAGGAALLVEPTDIDEIAAAIGRIATDDRLAGRMIDLGHCRAAAFTVDRFAARLAEGYAPWLPVRSE